jgi:hypothetical protein
MPPTNTTRPAPAIAGGEPRKSDRRGGSIFPSNTQATPKEQGHLAAELKAARQHLERRAEANAIIAQWRDELRHRLARARLKFELIGIPSEEHDAIVAEVSQFKRLCRALGWTGRKS